MYILYIIHESMKYSFMYRVVVMNKEEGNE